MKQHHGFLAAILLAGAATISLLQWQVGELRSESELSRAQFQRLQALLEEQEREAAARLERLAAECDSLRTDQVAEAQVARTQALASSAQLQTNFDSSVAALRASLDETRGSVSVQQARLSALAQTAAERNATLARDLLWPTVQVRVGSDVGSGVLVFSRAVDAEHCESFVLTAHHVISEAIPTTPTSGKNDPVLVRAYDPESGALEDWAAEVAAWHPSHDLALLRIRSEYPFTGVARLASTEKLKAIRRFAPIYTVGCPLGHDPMPSAGQVTNQDKELNGERYWIVSAPTIFGNSGGGVFLEETRDLIGICSMVCVVQNLVPMPVSHMGVVVPGETVLRWLDAEGYGFIHDERMPRTVCDWMRTARERMSEEGNRALCVGGY